jgi:putative FmdB family regulatory protein
MPTYTFRCPKCGYKFSDVFSMKDYDGKKVICPKCKNKGVKRVFEGSFSIGKNAKSSCPTGTCPLTGE